MKNKGREISYFVLRVMLGLLFLIPGISKLLNPNGITGLLSQIGFPFPVLFAWILIIVEVVAGAALIIGWGVRESSWFLIIVLIVATLFVHVPSIDLNNPMTVLNILWHLVGIAGLAHVQSVGAGKYKI